MLRGEFPSAGRKTPAALREAYERRLRETVEATGVDAAAEESGVDRGTLRALANGESPELTLEAAAAVLAIEDGSPPADVVAAEARDVLLLGMTRAVVDVDAVASHVDAELEPREIQQKVEGRAPMTLTEYAHVHQFVEETVR
ncbi:MAG: DUF5791 family protein [Haloarculaceae archaeon]